MASELCCAAGMKRKLLPLVLGVVAVHIAALWLLQANWLRPPVALSMPDQVLIELVAPAAPSIVAPPPTTARPEAAKPPRTQAPAPMPSAAAPPLAVAEPTHSASTARGSVAPPPGAAFDFAPTEAPGAAAATAPSVTVAPPMAPRMELPSSAAAYLQNPKPPYPALSRRLGEQGKVVLRVLIGVDGQAQAVEIDQSSGFDRLDQAALGTVLRWRYLPGRRAGVPQAMWFNVPISFVLE